MDNCVAGCQPPAGATPLLRFGLPSPPGVVGMVMAPGSASGKHPFYVVRKCGLGCWLCVCSACTQPLLATGARCGFVCLGSGFGCAPPPLAGVLGCVCAPLAPSHSWPWVRGVGVCVWAWVSAAPRHSWLGCWAVCVLRLHPATPGHGCAVWVCVFGLGFRLRPATPGWGVGLCVCSACTQPLLVKPVRTPVAILGYSATVSWLAILR